jgi:hypothetical protein
LINVSDNTVFGLVKTAQFYQRRAEGKVSDFQILFEFPDVEVVGMAGAIRNGVCRD